VALRRNRPRVSRSSLRADCNALLGVGAHGRTRCAACARSAQTSGRESEYEARRARAAPAPALLIWTPPVWQVKSWSSGLAVQLRSYIRPVCAVRMQIRRWPWWSFARSAPISSQGFAC